MVWFDVAKTAAFYHSSSEAFTSGSPPIDGSEKMPFLAVYQTDRGDISSGTGGSEKVRLTSELWKAEACEGLMVFDVADLIMADGALVEVLGSYEHNESRSTSSDRQQSELIHGMLTSLLYVDVAPYLIHVKVFGEEVEGKLQFEHVNAVSILDGYRRTLLYRFPDGSAGEAGATVGNTAGCVHLLHEFERLDSRPLGAVKAEMETIEPTKDCSFVLRSYELLGSEGFGGERREPERLE